MRDGLELQNVIGKPLSIYGQRYVDWSRESNWIHQGSSNTNWLGRKFTKDVIKLTMTHGTIEEAEYEGHQILVIAYHWEYQYYIDSNGARIGNTVDVSNATLESEIHQLSNYYAIGYRIDDAPHKLEWSGQGALFHMTCVSSSAKATLKKAMKRIDLENKVRAVRDELIEIANETWNGGYTTSRADFVPYNARVGDKVFIQAHGRLRRGVIVDTSGSRFVVGYVTPSNFKDMKYKLLPLSLMYTTTP